MLVSIDITLRGASDLGRSVTPMFLLIGLFLYRFATFWGLKSGAIAQRGLRFKNISPPFVNTINMVGFQGCILK